MRKDTKVAKQTSKAAAGPLDLRKVLEGEIKRLQLVNEKLELGAIVLPEFAEQLRENALAIGALVDVIRG